MTTAGLILRGVTVAWYQDIALAILVGGLDLAFFSDLGGLISNPDGWWTLGYAVAGSVVLAVRRSTPVAVLVVLIAHAVGAVLLLPDFRPTLGCLLALYTVAAYCPRRRAIAALMLTYAVTTTFGVLAELSRPLAPLDSPTGVARSIFAAMLLVDIAAWGIGRWARVSRQNAAHLVQVAELQRREAVAHERASIARDMHDTVSSAVTAVLLHAAGARQLLPTHPEHAATALTHIEEAAQRATAELREMLMVLDEPVPDAGGPSDRPLDLDELVRTAQTVGIEVVQRVVGQARPLPSAVSDVATRVVQEALTNCAKHAGPGSTVLVEQCWTDTMLKIEVLDDGAGKRLEAVPGLSGGAGLTGLRERVSEVGGTFTARPLNGGFIIVCGLPTSPSVAPLGANANAMIVSTPPST